MDLRVPMLKTTRLPVKLIAAKNFQQVTNIP
jgi:hypothetical protein